MGDGRLLGCSPGSQCHRACPHQALCRVAVSFLLAHANAKSSHRSPTGKPGTLSPSSGPWSDGAEHPEGTNAWVRQRAAVGPQDVGL